MSLTRKIAFLVCPSLRDEIAALQSGNTKAVLENEMLREIVGDMSVPMEELGDSRRYLRSA